MTSRSFYINVLLYKSNWDIPNTYGATPVLIFLANPLVSETSRLCVMQMVLFDYLVSSKLGGKIFKHNIETNTKKPSDHYYLHISIFPYKNLLLN